MGRCCSRIINCTWIKVAALFLCPLLLAACGSSSSSNTPPPPPTPASVTLTPTDHSSIDVGSLLNFSAVARNAAGQPITSRITFNFISSNPDVLTIANSGAACAGKWDSLSTPIVCTPGPAGVSIVTAVVSGISSPPTTVYVHQHIDHIDLGPIDTPTTSCFSQEQTLTYQASVFANVGGNLVDISPTVGPLTWNTGNTGVATVTTNGVDLLPNQVRATAVNPGLTQISTSVSGVNSNAISFRTCFVRSIVLTVQNEGTTSLTLAAGTSKTIEATVQDELGNILTKPPLTWSSSNSAAVTVPTGTQDKTTATITGTAGGGASVIASCTPPACNSGLFPSQPVYPPQPISVIVTPKTTATSTAWVTSTQCVDPDTGLPRLNCGAILTQVNGTDGKIGSSIFLPNTPNSILFAPGGTRAYVGSRLAMMIVDPAATSGSTAQVVGVNGTVLAVSRDGTRVVVAGRDQLSTPVPNRVFIFNQSNTTAITLQIPNATAAAFSPDGLKAFIVSSTGSAANLYAVSTVDAQKGPISLAPLTSANGLIFAPNGAFALASGLPHTITPVGTCNNAVLPSLTTPGVPLFLTAIPDATHLIALDPPSIDILSYTSSVGDCASTFPSVTLSLDSSTNLGQGDFTPITMQVASDGSKAYVVAEGLSSVLVFDITAKTTSAIPLVDNGVPLSASLSTDGRQLYVATDCPSASKDATTGKCTIPTLHILDTTIGSDVQQVKFDNNFCTNIDNLTLFCTPNLVAVKP